jgi:hypothetical protein
VNRLGFVIVAVSLLLFVAVAAMWVRSYWRADGLVHARPGRQSGVWSHSGRLMFDTVGDDDVPVWPGWRAALHGWEHFADPIDEPPFIDHPAAAPRGLLGFKWASVGATGMLTRRVTTIAIPFWSIALLLSLPPLLAAARAVRRRTLRRKHICVTCGYDLRASRERCPECGTAITP